LVSAAIGKTVSVMVSFPLESFVIQHQSKQGNEILDLFKGKQRFTGFSSTLQNEIGFSLSYWFVYHNLYEYVSTYIFNDSEGDVLTTVTTGLVSGTIASLLTYPLEAVKISRIVSFEKFKENSNLQILLHLSRSNGFAGMMSGRVLIKIGVGVRLWRAWVSALIYLPIYANTRIILHDKFRF